MTEPEGLAPVVESGGERPVVRLSTQSVPRWAVIGIFLLLLIAGIAYARDFLMPVALAFLLALVFSPVRRFLERRRVPAEASAVLIVGALVGLLLSGVPSARRAGAGSWIEGRRRSPASWNEDARPLRQCRRCSRP
ncbi:MAG: hypothetical protein R3C69_07595 [Geminicoccaceae bacterium]